MGAGAGAVVINRRRKNKEDKKEDVPVGLPDVKTPPAETAKEKQDI